MSPDEFFVADLRFAERLAAKVNAYWGKRGYDIRTSIRATKDGFIVRSNLDGRGYPPRRTT